MATAICEYPRNCNWRHFPMNLPAGSKAAEPSRPPMTMLSIRKPTRAPAPTPAPTPEPTPEPTPTPTPEPAPTPKRQRSRKSGKGKKKTKKIEEPKIEEPKIEEPKIEEPKIEEPKIEKPVTVWKVREVEFCRIDEETTTLQELAEIQGKLRKSEKPKPLEPEIQREPELRRERRSRQSLQEQSPLPPPPRKSRVCQYAKAGDRCPNRNCDGAHSNEEYIPRSCQWGSGCRNVTMERGGTIVDVHGRRPCTYLHPAETEEQFYLRTRRRAPVFRKVRTTAVISTDSDGFVSHSRR